LLRVAEAGVVAEGVAHEVGELGERLDARVARSDEDEREMGADAFRVRLGGGRLQLAEHVVAEVDGVREALEPEGVLGEARDRQGARHGAERHDEVVVLELERAALGHGVDAPCGFVDGGRPPE
jgi:hypothetical protein